MESDWRRRVNTPEEYLETERLLLRARESEFIMTPEYTKNIKARFYRELALDYYQTVHDPRTMDAVVLYVAINFFDRVISQLQEPPKILLDKQDNFNLFLICCHSISWKLRDNNFDIYSFLTARKYKFGVTGVMKMETAILEALDWKTKQTLPFHFVPLFLHYLTLPRGFTSVPVHKIIIWTQADIGFTKFRPSAVAASAILCALAKLFRDDSNDFATVILSRYPRHDDTIRGELAECREMMQRTFGNKMNNLVYDSVETSLNLALGASTMPPESSKESLEEGSQRQRKKTVTEEASEGIIGIETVSEQSSSAGDGRGIPVKRSHRPGKEPIDEESSEGFCRPVQVPKDEIEELQDDVVDDRLMNFELGWDDQNPCSPGPGNGMCSLCDALAWCWPIPIYWLRHSWEWLINLRQQQGGTPTRQAAQRPGRLLHEDSESSPEPSYRILDFFRRNANAT
ncbi:hypothetical protein DCAR_0309816 [Daucus carota subsp. sativus]|uniref:Uncharacterized protein n=1 Tax=Daucus carota subsp. sativus TaxID=79200 RepID=A0A165ZEM6_DAUCS|nr:PREDICTED: cyclin-D1-1-like [Daucus carota subsp. sativus]WOG90572.1 hypothetical protein DCAR_0309816 [Daucus carota subsp. sativus]